jgi:hypothetical protein
MEKENLRHLIRQIIKESFNNVEEGSGSHSDAKEMRKTLKWISKNLEGIKIEEVGDGHRICPPIDKSDECYTVHRGGKGIYDLYRFLAKAYNVNKHDIEYAVSSNRPLNLTSVNPEELAIMKKVNLSGKDWYIDEKEQRLIMVKNLNKIKNFDDLDFDEYEKVIEAL